MITRWNGVYVREAGACADGVTDDSAAIIEACRAIPAGGQLTFSPGVYVVRRPVQIMKAMTILGRGAVILMALEGASAAAFDVTSSGVRFAEGMAFRSLGSGGSVTRRAVYIHGTPTERLAGCEVSRCTFEGLSDGSGSPPYASHAIHAVCVDDLTVERNRITRTTGAGVLIADCSGVRVVRNSLENTGWYSICLQRGNDEWEVAGNRITGDAAGVRMWGGSVYVMSDGARNTNGRIHHNHCSGVHTYAAGAINVESAEGVTIEANEIEGLSQPDGDTKHIRVMSRFGDGYNYGPCQDIIIVNNRLRANTDNDQGIYVDNQGPADQALASGLVITGNQMRSVDDARYFRGGIWVHGQQGGWQDLVVAENIIRGIPRGSPLPGLIGFNAYDGAPVEQVVVAGNVLRWARSMRADATVHIGLALGEFCDHITLRGNVIAGFYDNVRNYVGSGAHVVGLASNMLSGAAHADTNLAVPIN